MGRHPVVERDHAIDKVLDTFWERGFAATSMDDLLAATGMHKGSFYRCFGSKRTAFTEALYLYVERVAHDDVLPALSGSGSATSRLERLVMARLDSALRPGTTPHDGVRGCFVVNTATELAAHDEELAAQVRGALDALRAAFAALVAEAASDGWGSESLDADDAAHQLVATLQGLIVLGRAGYPSDELRGLAQIAVRSAVGATTKETPA